MDREAAANVFSRELAEAPRRPSLRARVFWWCLLGTLVAITLHGVALSWFESWTRHPEVAPLCVSPKQTWNWVRTSLLVGLVPGALLAWLVSHWVQRKFLTPIETFLKRHGQRRRARNLWRTPSGAADTLRPDCPLLELLSRIERTIEHQDHAIADVAHELRTPLTAQVLVGENALARGGRQADLRDAISSMLEEAKHMKHLIEGLLILERVSGGRESEAEPSAMETVDLSALTHACAQTLQVLAEEKAQRLIVEQALPVWVNVDVTMMRQALLNVMHNAIEHCPEGVEIRVSSGRIYRHEAAVWVSDNGPGIRAEVRERVFQRFYRGSGVSRRRGLGLGLSIAKAILTAQGGRIELGTSIGGGCAFTLIVPLASVKESGGNSNRHTLCAIDSA